MSKRRTVDEILMDKFLEEYSDLFDSLSNNIRCPRCKQFVSGKFYNLGPDYNSFEGCKDCYEKTKETS